MSRIKIYTDSTADLPPALAKELDITVIPMTTTFGSQVFRDGVDLTNEEFYRKLAESETLPTTAQQTPQELLAQYEKGTADGSSIIAIHLSSGLSGTVQSALMARSMLPPGRDVTIIDSLGASLGQGMLAIRAAKMAAAGADKEEIVQQLENLKKHLHLIFTLDTLKYLLKGGRINRVQAVMGSLLDIKPILHMNAEGKIDQLDKVRSRRAAIRRLLSLVEENGQNLDQQVVGISHARCLEEAVSLGEQIRQKFGVRDVIISEIGAVIGTHVGEGCLAVFFEGREKN